MSKINLSLSSSFESQVNEKTLLWSHKHKPVTSEKMAINNKSQNSVIRNINDNITSSNLTSSLNSPFTLKDNEKIIYMNRIKTMLNNEQIEVGYSSLTENYIESILEDNPNLTKEVINSIYIENFADPAFLHKLIEVVSNLDYEKMYPTNTILALGTLNHKDVRVQEASIASFEKWDDKKNLSVLQNIEFCNEWLKEYAEEVIEYLEGC